jgi:hypothetical protein
VYSRGRSKCLQHSKNSWGCKIDYSYDDNNDYSGDGDHDVYDVAIRNSLKYP